MSNLLIKSPQQITLMRESGTLLARVFRALDEFIKAGISTMEINDFVEDYIVNTLQSRPASKGQYGYQYVLNSSINEVVCHGVPSPVKKLKERDIVNIDITLEKNGYIADSSKMYTIGEVLPLAQKLVDVTYDAMW
ncbi:MAG: M24 family metallopeptidase, partial [Paraglaciecola sp.]